MHRFYLAPAECRQTTLFLKGREAHHALHVLRVRVGDRVQVLDGEGHVLDCEVAHLQRDELNLAVRERVMASPPPCRITLGQALPKGKLFDAIIQKATELGAYRIVPLLTERVVSKLQDGDQQHKLEKWRWVAVEAIKQCGSPWLPRLEPPSTLEQFLSLDPSPDLALVGSLGSKRRHPRTCFEEFARIRGHSPESVSIAIGPEGDFTAEELSKLESAGAQPITLGPQVLRTETAAVYCLSIINYELQPREGLLPEPGLHSH